jgi:hypothetical protein
MAHTYQVLFGDGAQAAEADFYDQLTSVEVEEHADLPGAIQITLPVTTDGTPGDGDLTVVSDQRFKPYARLAIVVSAQDQPDACIFDGFVLSHRIHQDCGTTSSSAQVWGQDVSCLMNLEEKVHEWTKSDAGIANEIFGKYSFHAADDNGKDDSGPHPDTQHTVMQRGTDAQFLRDRARRTGRLFRVCCDQRAGANTGYFAKPNVEGDPKMTLVLNPAEDANIDALDFSWDVARPTEVKAKALVMSKEPVDGGSTTSSLTLLDSTPLSTFTGSTGAMTTRLTATVDGAGELRTRAESLLAEANWFVTCEGEGDLSRLNAVIRAGTLVRVNGAGRLHSGKYFVWSVRHVLTADSHRMKFVLVRNAVGA